MKTNYESEMLRGEALALEYTSLGILFVIRHVARAAKCYTTDLIDISTSSKQRARVRVEVWAVLAVCTMYFGIHNSMISTFYGWNMTVSRENTARARRRYRTCDKTRDLVDRTIQQMESVYEYKDVSDEDRALVHQVIYGKRQFPTVERAYTS